MAIPGATQALIAAFAFGIVVNSASAALFLNVKGHGSSILRDGPRLVLITFLLSAALWAQTDFISIFIETAATTSCQVGIIFSTLFDQLGRFSIEQYLLWVVNGGSKSGIGQLGPQILVGIRFVLGAVFVGFSRPQTVPVCIPISSVLPLAILVVVLDAVIIATLAARAFFAGVLKDIRESSTDAARGKAILLVLVGLTLWTATSVTMLLGMETMELTFRTTVPAAGLICLLFAVTGCAGAITLERTKHSRQPESPRRRDLTTDRSLSTSDSDEYPPNRYEDLKRGEILSITAFVQPQTSDRPGGLPKISRPITGFNGMGGVPVQGQLFPPIRGPLDSHTVEPRRTETKPEARQKRSLFDLKRGPATDGGLSISSPILQANGNQNPLNKIPTIDLETAARNERERRANDLQRESALIAKRPAPQPPSMPPAEAVKRAVSFKRKEVASIGSQPSLPSSLEPMPSVAATSSAQLSPGVEEIRRRSPRQVPTDLRNKGTQPTPSPKPPAVVPYQPPESTGVEESEPVEEKEAQAARRVDIRPSRGLAPSPKTPPPEPVKTALQRRPTNGLPGNPRAMAVKPLAKESTQQRQQTVMFMNNIVYDDPSVVQSIIDNANPKMANKEVDNDNSMDRSASVVHRPRPIPRKPEKDRAIFPAEPSPNQSHRRSRSGGSIISRKSILRSAPGSPTQLPPLPPPPKGFGNSERPHPNDTKSMTFDEKMNLFYSGPSSGGDRTTKRRSSIPEMPKIPLNFMDVSPTTEDFENERRDSKATHRTTRTSIKTESLFEEAEMSLVEPSMSRGTGTERGESMTDDLGNSWLPEVAPTTERPPRPFADETAKRASSPIIPPVRESAMTESTNRTSSNRTQDDASSNWGSVHSPIAINIPTSRFNARSTYIKSAEKQEPLFQLASTVYQDPGSAKRTLEQPMPKGWHRRIGDELPTFSERKETMRTRKMPPPMPLQLGPPSTKNPVIPKAAEPSPLESPEHAIKYIQDQLKQFEQPDPASFDSPGQRFALLQNLENEMDMQEGQWQQMHHNMRDSTSTMRTSPTTESRRESLVSVTTREPSRDSSVRMTLADRRASRRSRMRSGGSYKSEDAGDLLDTMDKGRASVWQQRIAEAQMEYMENANELQVHRTRTMLSMAQLGSPTPPESDESDVEEISRPKSINAIVEATDVAPAPKALWTQSSQKATQPTAMLWELSKDHTESAPSPVTVSMAAEPSRPAVRKQEESMTIQSSELWRLSVKTVKTKSHSGLWQPPYARAPVPSQTTAPPHTTEQQSKTVQKTPRPLTQRPPRRTRRVTLLPDIVENPEPLPDKRGTLGIFQFPWGEKSDTATIQPRNTAMFMAMPGTMSSGGSAVVNAALEARSKQLEAAEYSSSFFDDYDDEKRDSDEYGSDGDDFDDFDETTLWEIASLLKTDSVPSRDSLIPSEPSSERFSIGDYISEVPSDEENEDNEDDEHRESIIVGIEDGIATAVRPKPTMLWTSGSKNVKRRSGHGLGLPNPDAATWMKYDDVQETVRAKPRRASIAMIESTTLWSATQSVQHSALWTARKEMKLRGQHSRGLAQPDERTWQKYDLVQETARAKPRKAEPATIESADLWSVPPTTETKRYSGTWVDQGRIQKRRRSRKFVGTSLWAPPVAPAAPATENKGLFRVEPTHPDNRTTEAEPAALEMDRKPRTIEEKPLEKFVSSSLWTAAPASATTERVWILEKEPVPEPVVLDDTIPSTNVGVKQPTWWEKMKAQAGLSAVPVPPMAQPVENVPLRQQFRRSVAFRADWDGELQAAVAASYPPQKKQPKTRQAASEEQWDDALKQALADSYPKTVKKPQATNADWESALQEAISLSAPAPQVSNDDSNQAMIMAQIEALEQERLFVERAMRGDAAIPEPKQETTQLWSRPEQLNIKAAQAVEGPMWTPGPKTESRPASLLPQSNEDAEEAGHRRSKSRKEQRRAEIRAQIAALENGADPAELGLAVGAGMQGQSMWSSSSSKGDGEKDWLDESSRKRESGGVVLRY
ncbi:uncharacterized protein E0L32_001358 [Thyridium curvatum]|uniref:Uncharacterized protein n=1 Tax=Thyridium curvatum TaxID=1093900 RepID=A0A507AZ79_9PEZI|nr:uncharacterized protein E0L32_001358 [Thyridium curvatum]TPX10161.1 hypothetical protein E0L32_001358 [Thyridium curvatum]